MHVPALITVAWWISMFLALPENAFRLRDFVTLPFLDLLHIVRSSYAGTSH